ncbi:MAG: nickel-responsive transcriptional regulator NikR [Thiolinea sp.]
MERYTISLEDELAQAFAGYIEKRGYQNRSEAMRDLIREKLAEEQREYNSSDGSCIANLTYVYNHHERELAKRLTHTHHAHHGLNLSTLHIHLDHDNCMEIVVLKGKATEVQDFADRVISQPGVRHGHLYILPDSSV